MRRLDTAAQTVVFGCKLVHEKSMCTCYVTLNKFCKMIIMRRRKRDYTPMGV